MDWIRKKREERKEVEGQREPIQNNFETLEEKSQRWLSIRIVYFTMFLMTLGFSIIITGVWPYLDKVDPEAGKVFMGYVVGANPFGQMLFSPLIGWWANRMGSIRLPIIASLSLFTASSAAYSLLEVFPSHRKYWMVITRFLVGVSSANVAVIRSYVSEATMIGERTSAIAMVSLAQTLGFVIGPGLQAIVTPLGDRGYKIWIGGEGEGSMSISLNMYTAAGWINVFMGLINLILFIPWIFKEKRIAAAEAMRHSGKENEKDTWKGMKPDYIGAWTMICAFFVFSFNFVLLETLGTSLVMDQFAWSKSKAIYYMGILMSVGAIVACATSVAIGPLCRWVDERKVLLYGGFFLMLLGGATYIPWGNDPPKIARVVHFPSSSSTTDLHNGSRTPNTSWTKGAEIADSIFSTTPTSLFNYSIDYDKALNNVTEEDEELLGCPETQTWCFTTPALTVSQLLIGYSFIAVGYPIGITLIQTIFSKILGPRPQGVWMGFITGSGCLSRVMGPIFVSYIYTTLGPVWTFGTTTSMMAASMLWLYLVRRRLKVTGIEKQQRSLCKSTDAVESNSLAKDGTAEVIKNEFEMHPIRSSLCNEENGVIDSINECNRTTALLSAEKKPKLLRKGDS